MSSCVRTSSSVSELELVGVVDVLAVLAVELVVVVVSGEVGLGEAADVVVVVVVVDVDVLTSLSSFSPCFSFSSIFGEAGGVEVGAAPSRCSICAIRFVMTMLSWS